MGKGILKKGSNLPLAHVQLLPWENYFQGESRADLTPFLKITGDVNESLQGFAEKFKKTLEGTDIKIIYNKPLPPDTYGEDYPAYEYEIEWKWRGTVEFTTYYNVIAKEGYLILVAYTFSRAVDRAEAEAEAKAIFKTIDLKP